MRISRLHILAVAVLVASYAYIERATERIGQEIKRFASSAFDLLISIVPSTAPRLAFADAPAELPPAYAFADPSVPRHEAGMARRAAARHL